MERMSRMRSIHFYPLLRIEGIGEELGPMTCVLARAFNETVFFSDDGLFGVSRLIQLLRQRQSSFSFR